MKEADWREFEKLSARIEGALAPKGAVVKSPDKIRDIVTGSSREVDASIRYKIGTVPILITVECRKRDSTQDVTWIEQLATKKQNIGAAKTIAVSSSSFSAPAIKSAETYGIEVRTIEKISVDDIKSWVKFKSIEHVMYRAILKTFKARLNGKGGEVRFDPAVIEQLNSRGTDARVFVINENDHFLCIKDFFHHYLSRRPEILKDIPKDGTKIRREIRIKFEPDVVHVKTTEGLYDLNSLLLGLDFFVETYETPITNLSEYYYYDAGKAVVRSCEFTTSHYDQSWDISIHQKAGLNELAITISKETNIET